MVGPVHIAAGALDQFALPPGEILQFYIVVRWLDQFRVAVICFDYVALPDSVFTISHCRPMVETVRIAAGSFDNSALPPEGFTSSRCRPIAGLVCIASGEFDKFVLPSEVWTSSRCRPMAGPV